MASYHITDDGPRACSTTPDRCPYGRSGGDHFDNVADAQQSFEHIMEEKFGAVASSQAKQNRESDIYRLYDRLDRVERDNENYRRIAQVASYSRSAPSKNPRIPYKPSGRSKGYDRMRRGNPGRRISKMAVRNGKQLFTAAEQTPDSVLRIQSHFTRGDLSTGN